MLANNANINYDTRRHTETAGGYRRSILAGSIRTRVKHVVNRTQVSRECHSSP